MDTGPLLPPRDRPEPKTTDPLTPELAVPVLSTNIPLTPFAPEFEVRSVIDPLEVEDPNPLLIEMAPPLLEDDIPALNVILPPRPLSPDPTKI